jgi:threonine/homoserine/homoserine lactone efflux protein
MLAFLKGLAAGLVVAAPVGPVGAFSASRILAGGRRSGIACALAIGTADGLYSLAACLGIGLVQQMLQEHERLFLAVAGGLLLVLGLKTLLKPLPPPECRWTRSLRGTFGQVFALSLLNPWAVFVFASLFAGFGAPAGAEHAPALVAGVFVGSAGWWVAMTWALHRLQSILPGHGLKWVGWIAGVLLLATGAGAFTRLAF